MAPSSSKCAAVKKPKTVSKAPNKSKTWPTGSLKSDAADSANNSTDVGEGELADAESSSALSGPSTLHKFFQNRAPQMPPSCSRAENDTVSVSSKEPTVAPPTPTVAPATPETVQLQSPIDDTAAVAETDNEMPVITGDLLDGSNIVDFTNSECARDMLNGKLGQNEDDVQTCQKLLNSFGGATRNKKLAEAGVHADLTQKQKDCIEACKAGVHVDVRSALGQDYYRATKVGAPLHKALEAAKAASDNPKKASLDFELAWQRSKRDEITKRSSWKNAWQRVDKTKGVYKTISKIAIDEGNDAAARIGAQKIAIKCTAMGGDWLWVDPMSELTKFMHLEMSWSEELSEAFTMFEDSKSERAVDDKRSSEDQHADGSKMARVDQAGTGGKLGGIPACDNSPLNQRGNPPVVPKDKRIGKIPSKAPGKPPASKTPPPKAPLDIMLKNASILKTTLLRVTASSMNLLETINTSEDWDDFNNEKTLLKITTKTEALKMSMKPFDRDFLNVVTKDVKTKYSDQVALAMNVKQFLQLEGPADELQKTLNKIKNAQAGYSNDKV
jgi:hypothetical protein